MTITPTIRPEIKKENERQRKQMMERHKEYKKLINASHASNFGKMLNDELKNKGEK